MPAVLQASVGRCANTPVPSPHSDEGCPLSSDISLHYKVGFEPCHRQKSGRLPAIKQGGACQCLQDRTAPTSHCGLSRDVRRLGTDDTAFTRGLLLTFPRHWQSSPDALGGSLLCPQNLLYTSDSPVHLQLRRVKSFLRVTGF